MTIFLESFGLIIAVALFGAWGIFLSIRYPLGQDAHENQFSWLNRFCQKYQGKPCKQMKLFIWSCGIGTAMIVIFNAYALRK
jgi:hypothetical protein